MLQGIKSLIEDFVKRNQPILFYNLKPSIVEIFQGVQPKDFKYCRNENELNELLKGKQRRATVAWMNEEVISGFVLDFYICCVDIFQDRTQWLETEELQIVALVKLLINKILTYKLYDTFLQLLILSFHDGSFCCWVLIPCGYGQ
jgi:hypothetical protein